MNYSFADAVSLLTDGKACKRPSNGYLKRVDGEEGAYSLVFVKREGAQSTYAVSAAGAIPNASPISLDVDLFAGMVSNDWIVGSTAEFEAARSGSGVW